MRCSFKYALPLLFSSVCFSSSAELQALNDTALKAMTGQTGITLSGRVGLKEGTRISYQNSDAEYQSDSGGWLVIDDLTGEIEFDDLDIDLVKNAGVAANKTAMKITLPSSISFKEFSVGGVYLGSDKNKTAEHHFLLSAKVQGQLKMPSRTTATIFATDQ